jgi:DNA replication protein DnaC
MDWVWEDENSISHVTPYAARLKYVCSSCSLEQVKASWDRMGIPKRFLRANLDNYKCDSGRANEQEIVVKVCRDYSVSLADKGQAPNMLFLGIPGTGKTHLAVGILKVVGSGMYTSFFNLTRQVKGTYDGEGSEETVLAPYLDTRLLVIDDIDTAMKTQWEVAFLSHFVTHRWARGLPTIFISNDTIEELAQRVTAGAYSRLTSFGNIKLNFNWDDYRMRQ